MVNAHARTAKVRKKQGRTDIIEGADLKSWSVLEKKRERTDIIEGVSLKPWYVLRKNEGGVDMRALCL